MENAIIVRQYCDALKVQLESIIAWSSNNNGQEAYRAYEVAKDYLDTFFQLYSSKIEES